MSVIFVEFLLFIINSSSSDDNLNDLQGVICEPEKGDLLKVEIVINGENALYNMPKHELALVRHDFQNGNLVYAKYGSNKGIIKHG